MSEKDSIEKLTKQLLCIHIDCNRLAIDERGILERLAKLGGSKQVESESRKEYERKTQWKDKIKTDRFGNTLQIRDKVEFLTDEKFNYKRWTVY